jgi:hypothetical protein
MLIQERREKMGLAYDKAYVLGELIDVPGYVNAYIISLGYGGPEEGGWWYDVYAPLASIRVSNEEQTIQAFNILEDLYKEAWKDEPKRSSVVSNGDLMITVEDHWAEFEPKEQPHYC